MKLLPFEKDIVNLGFTSVDNVILRVTIWSITLSTICYLYNNIVVVCYFMQSGQCCCDRMLIRFVFTDVMGAPSAR